MRGWRPLLLSMNESLTELLDRLAKSVADYRAFVRTTRSHQLSCEGAREAIAAMEEQHDSALTLARAELALANFPTSQG